MCICLLSPWNALNSLGNTKLIVANQPTNQSTERVVYILKSHFHYISANFHEDLFMQIELNDLNFLEKNKLHPNRTPTNRPSNRRIEWFQEKFRF